VDRSIRRCHNKQIHFESHMRRSRLGNDAMLAWRPRSANFSYAVCNVGDGPTMCLESSPSGSTTSCCGSQTSHLLSDRLLAGRCRHGCDPWEYYCSSASCSVVQSSLEQEFTNVCVVSFTIKSQRSFPSISLSELKHEVQGSSFQRWKFCCYR
jgi:hypothetical protein